MLLDPQRTIQELKELRALTGDENGAQRVAWTDTWLKARCWFESKLRACRSSITSMRLAIAGSRYRALLKKRFCWAVILTPYQTAAGWMAASDF